MSPEKIEFISGPGPRRTRSKNPQIVPFIRRVPEVPAVYEEPLPHKLSASELVPVIEKLRADSVEMTQLKIIFDDETGWVTAEPKFTLIFKKREGRVVAEFPELTPEELREQHRLLEAQYPGYKIERHYRSDLRKNFFWAFPPERKSIYRSDPYTMGLEVVKLHPKRLSIQHIPRIVRLPPGVRPEELPFRLRLLPPPKYPK